MGYPDDLIDCAIETLRRKPIDGYEICLDRSSRFEVEAKEGKIDTLQVSEGWGVAFRILNHHRLGFSYTTSSGALAGKPERGVSELERIIDDAIASSEDTAPDPCYDFAPSFQGTPPSLQIFDHSLKETSEKVKVERAMELEEAVRSVDPKRIRKVRKASYQEGTVHRTLINSNGLHVSYSATLCSVSVTAVAEEGEEAEEGWDADVAHFQKELDVPRVGREAGRRAVEGLGGRKIPSGAYPVVVEHRVALEFLSLLAHCFMSEQIQKGKSPLKGKKGERYFSPLLTIEDNGLHPKGIFSAPFDGEGTPTQQTPLVVQGEICGFLYDRYWANRETSSSGLNARSTGNSRRPTIKAPPGMGPSNFFIQPQERSFDQMLSDLHRGVLLEEVMGLHTVDPISGDFSLGCSGKWVEQGKIVHPVKSVAVAGNLYQLFRDVAGVGKDFRFLGGYGSPSLLIKEMKISGQ